MITLSEAGVFISDGSSYRLIPAHIRDIADVSGEANGSIYIWFCFIIRQHYPYTNKWQGTKILFKCNTKI